LTALKCAQFHPDGHLLAAGGVDGQIKIFEVKSGTEAAMFDLGGPVKNISFSENGIWVAGVVEGASTISIWDLRKAAQIATIDTGSAIDDMNWDYTGQFLAVAGEQAVSVQHYAKASKEWSEVLKKGTPATKVAWGRNARELVTLNQDGVIATLASG
jgi:pre-mRNA-processing factor 19